MKIGHGRWRATSSAKGEVTKQEIIITPEMVEAGKSAYLEDKYGEFGHVDLDEAIRAVYIAMESAKLSFTSMSNSSANAVQAPHLADLNSFSRWKKEREQERKQRYVVEWRELGGSGHPHPRAYCIPIEGIEEALSKVADLLKSGTLDGVKIAQL